MPDKSLLDFIVSQKRIGARIEKIRSDLRMNDWTDVDIDVAITYLENQEKNRARRSSVFKKIIYTITASILICLGIVLVMFFSGKKVPLITSSPVERIQFPDLLPRTVEAPQATTTPNSVDDILSVKKRFSEQFPGAQYIRAQKENGVMIVSGSVTDEFGTITTKEYVFVKNGDVWSVDMTKTQEREAAILEQASSTIPIAVAQPKVVEVKVRPAPPLVNNTQTEVLVDIKNFGRLETESLTFSVLFDTRDVFEGRIETPIGPDQIYTWRYRPYEIGKKYSDKKGKHTITITMPGEEPFTQEFDLY